MKRPLALLLCGACGWAVRVGAQPSDAPVPATIPRVEIAPIAPVGKVAPVAPIQIAPIGGEAKVGGDFAVAPIGKVAPIVGVGVAGAPGAATVKFNAQSLSMPPLLARLRVRELTPQKAYDKGELNADGALYILESLVDAWGGFYWDKNEDLRRDIVAILVAHGQDQIEDPAKFSPVVRLWLADYYVSIKDAKSLALSESVLAQLPHPLPAAAYDGPDFPLAFLALERIAWYYRYTQQFEKSAETWLRMNDYCAPTGWWAPDALGEAARAYSAAHLQHKADELYAQVAQYGDAWHTNMVSIDKAEHLMDDYKWAQAEQVLRDSLRVQQAMKVPSVPAQISLLSRLVTLRYIAGDFPGARALFQTALALSQQASAAERADSVARNVELARDYLKYIDKWERTPLDDGGEIYAILHPVTRAQEVATWDEKPMLSRVVLKGPRSTMVEAWVEGTPWKKQTTVSSFRAAPMTVASDNAAIKAFLVEREPSEAAVMSSTKDLWIEIAPQFLSRGQTMRAILTVSSPKFPGSAVNISVYIEVQ